MTTFVEAFEPALRKRLLEAGQTRTLAAGEVLVRRGERGRSLFLVLEGGLEAREGGKRLTVCGPGEVVGELGFLDGEPRSADLVANGPCVVVGWDRDQLSSLLGRDPRLHARLLEAIAMAQARAVRRLTGAPAAPAAPPPAVPLDRGTFRTDDGVIVTHEAAVLKLSPIEARLLGYLSARPGRVVSQTTLLDEVWGYARRARENTRTVYATVHRLRAKIERDPSAPRHLVSVSGEGYRFDP